MPGGLGPRFALEAGFLILLAAVATYAQLDTPEIVLVMAGGWLVTSVFEVLAARRERLYPGTAWIERSKPEAATADAEPEEPAEERLSWSRPPEAVSVRMEEAAVSGHPPVAASAPGTDDDATGEIKLPKRRRWFRRGERGADLSAADAVARPSARHVRLIRGSSPDQDVVEQQQQKDAGAGS